LGAPLGEVRGKRRALRSLTKGVAAAK